MCWKILYNLPTPVQRVSINPLSSKWKPVIYCSLEESNLFLYASCPAHSASWLTEGWEAKSCAPSFLSASGRQSSNEAGAVLVQSSLQVPCNIRGSQPLLSLPFAIDFGEGILFTCFWAETGTRAGGSGGGGFIPSLMVFLPLWPHVWDHAAIRAAEDTGDGFGAHSQ